jgi:transposase, IS5 family
MHQAKKRNNWYFGMKARIGVDIASGLVHSMATTPANVNDVTMAGALLHGDEEAAFGDAGYAEGRRRTRRRSSRCSRRPTCGWRDGS